MTLAPEACFYLAASNWVGWQDSFGQGDGTDGTFGALPVLQSDARFQRFCNEYSVYRGGRLHGGRELRAGARQALSSQLTPVSVEELVIACNLRTEKTGRIRIDWSGASKLLWFWRPLTFAPWDQYARRGLSVWDGAPEPETPSEHIHRFNTAISGWPGKAAVATLIQASSILPKNALVLRIAFDIHLMDLGGRWPHS